MQFDLASCLIGVLIGVVVAFLVRLHALKQLQLKLDRIGLNLGVEGFQPPERADRMSQSIGPVSGTGNEVNQAGRDINKTSNLYRMMQAAVREGQGVSADEPLVAQRRVSLELKSTNDRFVDELSAIQRARGNNWFERWIETCLTNLEFREVIEQKVKELQKSGWNAVLLEPSDNINRGLLVNIIAAANWTSNLYCRTWRCRCNDGCQASSL